MFTAEDARKTIRITDVQTISMIETKIEEAAKRFLTSVDVTLDRRFPKEAAQTLAQLFRDEPRLFYVRVDEIAPENFGPVEYYSLHIRWDNEKPGND